MFAYNHYKVVSPLYSSRNLQFYSGVLLQFSTDDDNYPYPEPVPIGEIENPLSFPVKAASGNFKILILGDIHGYDFEALVNDREAWLKYREKKTKAFDSSYENTLKVFEKAAESEIDYVIIPGDVTVDGEQASHRMLSSILANFEDRSGKKVFVVPGNHDVNNPRARQFLRNKFKYSPTIKEEEFVDLYSNFGYSEAYSRDEGSLSYAVEPEPGLVFLCLDTNKFQYNFYFPFRTSIPGSGLKKSTIFWIKDILKKANKEGKTIIAVHHHPLYEPVFKQKTTIPGSEKIREIYRNNNVAFVISAHRHKYYVNAADKAPQVTAPNISSTPANALEAYVAEGTLTLTLDPYNYSE